MELAIFADHVAINLAQAFGPRHNAIPQKGQSKMLKRLTYTCMAIFALGNIAMAELPAVPKKFQGTWIDVDGGGSMTIGANTVSFGSS
jgi:preprotein translocase subunit SecG